MRRFAVLLFVMLISVCACKKKQEDIIAGIKKKYTEINEKIKDYTPRRVDDITNPGGGTITGYYKGDEVKKVIAAHFSDSTRTFIEFYFDDGFLIMIWEQNYVYNRPMQYTEEVARAKGDSVWYDDKKTLRQTSLFYFHKNKLVKWLNRDGEEVAPATADFVDMESILWGQTAILLKQLKQEP